MPPTHIVIGQYDGPIDAKPGEKVVFIGDCTTFNGPIAGQLVQIESEYVDRSQKDPLEAEYGDIFKKMWTVGRKMRVLKKQDVVRLSGCPVSVAEQVLALVSVGGLKNPYFDMKQAIPFTSAYLSWRTRKAIKELVKAPYNQPGPCARGAARPEQNQPPADMDAPLEAG
jgi:hypothetical protein